MVQTNSYKLNREVLDDGCINVSTIDFWNFCDVIHSSGLGHAVHNDDNLAESFASLIYRCAQSPDITVVKFNNETYSVFSGRDMLAKTKGGHLVKIWLPGVKNVNDDTYFLNGDGMEYVINAGFPDLVTAGNDFLSRSFDLKNLYIPNLKKAGHNLLRYSRLPRFYGPSLVEFGDYCLYRAEDLVEFSAHNLVKPGKYCLHNNNGLKRISIDKVKDLPDGFLCANTKLKEASAKKLNSIGRECHPIFSEIASRNLAKHM